jgi:hypothetical protein
MDGSVLSGPRPTLEQTRGSIAALPPLPPRQVQGSNIQSGDSALSLWLWLLKDDHEPEAVFPLWRSLDDEGRRELLERCYANRELVGPRALGLLLDIAWHRGPGGDAPLSSEGPTASISVAWGIPFTTLAALFERADPLALMGAGSLEKFRRLPAAITVYRGTAGVPVEVARRGMSWSLHKPSAMEFAWRNADRGEPVILLAARVHKRDVLAGFNLDKPIAVPELVCKSGAPRVTKVKVWRRRELDTGHSPPA